jgi:hypothetical protein
MATNKSRPSSAPTSKVTYRVVPELFWDQHWAAVPGGEPNARELLVYLVAGPLQRAVPGVLRVGEGELADKMGWPAKAVRQLLGDLATRGLIHVDQAARLVWLPWRFDHEAPKSPDVVRGKGWRAVFERWPSGDLAMRVRHELRERLAAQGRAFEEAFASLPNSGDHPPASSSPTLPGDHPPASSSPTLPGDHPPASSSPTLPGDHPPASSSPTLPGDHPPASSSPTLPGDHPPASSSPTEGGHQRSSEAEKQGEKEKDLSADAGASPTSSPSPLALVQPKEPPGPKKPGDAEQVFERWKTVMGKNGASKFKGKRRTLVEARLRDGYSVQDLCKAIDGCRLSPFHMGRGDNKSGQKHNDLELICRDVGHVEKFMEFVDDPPEGAPAHPGGWRPITGTAERFRGVQDSGVDLGLSNLRPKWRGPSAPRDAGPQSVHAADHLGELRRKLEAAPAADRAALESEIQEATGRLRQALENEDRARAPNAETRRTGASIHISEQSKKEAEIPGRKFL